MKNSKKNRKTVKAIKTTMTTDLGERSLNKQHNNRTIVIPKIALDNCGCDTTSDKKFLLTAHRYRLQVVIYCIAKNSSLPPL